MNEPDPSSPDRNKSIFTALIDAFKELPPILSFVGLITVIGVLILSLTGVLPEIFLIYPAIGLAAFLIYAYLNNRHEMEIARLKAEQEAEWQRLKAQQEADKQRLEHELEKLKVEQSGELEKERIKQKTGLEKAKLKVTSAGGTSSSKSPEPEPPSAASWPESYYGYVWMKCAKLHMTSIDPKAAELGAAVLDLHKVFTTLDVPADPKEKQVAAGPVNPDNRTPALKVLCEDENQYLVLLGQPGSGKSTLVNYLGLCLSGTGLQKPEANLDSLIEQDWSLPALLPVLVILRDYAAKSLLKKQDIWAYVVAGLRNEGLAKCIEPLEQHLKAQGGLLLLDGLDEVPDARDHREHLRKAILRFASDFPKARVVVTSRPYAYQDPEWQLTGFNQTMLLDFSPEQIARYIDSWYDVAGPLDPNLGEERARQYAAQLKTQVERNPSLQELAPRPLLLALMVSLHRWQSGGLLPERREQLYNDAVNMLLERWQRRKLLLDEEGRPRGEEKNALEELGIKAEELRNALSQLAFEAHRDQAKPTGTADIAHKDLVDALRRVVPKDKRKEISSQKIADYVRDRAGLLEDRGEDVYGFPHRTFQEYLAAMYLLEQEEFPQNIASLFLGDYVRWREAVLLAGNTANRALKWALIEQLYNRKDPPQEGEAVDETQWQGVFLAGKVLHDSGLIKEDTAIYAHSRDQVHGWHKAILTHGALHPRDRADAGDLLAELGDARPGVLTCDDMRLCYVPPGDFWMADKQGSKTGHSLDILDKPYWLAQYPVTVAQFREFVHSNPDYKPAYGDRPFKSPDNRPVVYVNWYDALAFCEWLNRRWRSRLPDGYRVTLPSEAEWEKAARGGKVIPVDPHVVTAHSLKETLAAPPVMTANPLPRREYPWGDEPEKPETADEVYRANIEAAGVGRPTAVGSFPKGVGRTGCLDMSGNVWEWTRSYYDKERPYRLSAEYETIDPRNKEGVLLCGGSFWNEYNGCSARYWNVPHDLFDGSYGFRVAVSPFVSEL